MSEVRLQLFLAKAGVASRRRAGVLIGGGHVTVNGAVVRTQGVKVDAVRDRVAVDGKEVAAEAPRYLLLHKPKGTVTTASDPDDRPTVFSLLGEQGVRLFSVGRLDYNTEGALLLTNDGELAHRLMHPSRGVDKIYQAKLQGHITSDQLGQMRAGVELPPLREPAAPRLPGGMRPQQRARPEVERSAPCEVQIVRKTRENTWIELVLHEGKNRQVHRMAVAVGTSVLKLVRVQYGTLTLEGLEPGQWRALSVGEVNLLRQIVGLSKAPRAPRPEPAAAPEPAVAPGRPARGARPAPSRREPTSPPKSAISPSKSAISPPKGAAPPMPGRVPPMPGAAPAPTAARPARRPPPRRPAGPSPAGPTKGPRRPPLRRDRQAARR